MITSSLAVEVAGLDLESVCSPLLLFMVLIFAQRRAASYGKKVAVIERHPYLGGTCVNVGKLPFSVPIDPRLTAV